MTNSEALTDEELRALCEQAISQSTVDGSEVAADRSAAMARYMGEPDGTEQEGRSQFVTREVLETIEFIMPSLMRMFADAENMVHFEPTGPEDQEAAAQETEAISHAFWQRASGFLSLYQFIKDGLLQKTGVLKVWWDNSPSPEREEYAGLSEWELGELFADPTSNIEVESVEQDQESGRYDVVLLVQRDDGRLRIEPVPPEEFGISQAATSPDANLADFVFHRTRKTKAELVDAGFDRSVVEDLPASLGNLDEVAQERAQWDYNAEAPDHWSLERVWVTEIYIRVDRDGDGVAELLKVTLGGSDSQYSSGSELLDVEEVDRQPFVSWSPIIIPHAFHGLSAADLVDDIQRIKTTLTRQILDSTYLANNGRMAVNNAVNLDDLKTSRPGGIVRTKGETPPGQHIMPIPQQPPPPQTFELLGHFDEQRRSRIGTEDVAALDSATLSNVNTGVAALAFDASRAKIELIARICAELGLRPLFLRMHELLRKNSSAAMSFRSGGEWVQVQPQEWRTRSNMGRSDEESE